MMERDRLHPLSGWVELDDSLGSAGNEAQVRARCAVRITYHTIRPRYAQRYLAEFEYRFNRRFHLPVIIPRLVHGALRTPPMSERLLELHLA